MCIKFQPYIANHLNSFILKYTTILEEYYSLLLMTVNELYCNLFQSNVLQHLFADRALVHKRIL